MLSARGLRRDFAGFVAVRNVDLDVHHGKIHALIGPNGAGKTTVFNLLTKFLQPTSGIDHARGTGHHQGFAGQGGAHGPRALVPDLGDLSAFDRARQRPCRLAAAAWAGPPILAIAHGARSADAARRGAVGDSRARRCAPPAGRRPLLWPQACRWRSPPRWRSIRRCCCSTSRRPAWDMRMSAPSPSSSDRSPRDRAVLMVEHNLSVVADLCRPGHRPAARRGARRRRLRHRQRATPACARPIWAPGMPDRRLLCGSRAQCLVRRKPCAARRRSRGLGEGETVTLLGRNGVGKTTTLARHHGADPQAERSDHLRRRGPDAAAACTGSPASASASCPRSAASSRR